MNVIYTLINKKHLKVIVTICDIWSHNSDYSTTIKLEAYFTSHRMCIHMQVCYKYC